MQTINEVKSNKWVKRYESRKILYRVNSPVDGHIRGSRSKKMRENTKRQRTIHEKRVLEASIIF